METPGSRIVEIAREFLLAYRRSREISALHRAGELCFEDVRGWVGDDESSTLYRLKERCHALFRELDGRPTAMATEALFDLTIGALFHEAMRFRENLYQREVYGPRVGQLQGESAAEAGLIREFNRIVAGAAARLDEALRETEALLEQTRRQFHGLLIAHRNDGLVSRFLVENAGYVVLAFEGGVDRLFEEMYQQSASGHARAARSYLDSGHFREGARALVEARSRGGDREAWVRLGDYAEAMQAYLDGDYSGAVRLLSAWLDRHPPAEESAYAALALDAMSHLGQLAEAGEGKRIAADAERIVERLRSVAATIA